MKKFFIFSAGVMMLLLPRLHFHDYKTVSSYAATTISCVPAIAFEDLYNPPIVMVRKDVYSHTTVEIVSIETDNTTMKTLPILPGGAMRTSW